MFNNGHTDTPVARASEKLISYFPIAPYKLGRALRDLRLNVACGAFPVSRCGSSGGLGGIGAFYIRCDLRFSSHGNSSILQEADPSGGPHRHLLLITQVGNRGVG